MHVHPTYFWEESDSAAYTYGPEEALVYSPVTIALLAVNNLRSVNDIMVDVKRAIGKGWVSGPKVFLSGRLIVPTGGHVHYLPGLANQADGPYGFRRAVREEIRAGADFIKLANNGADMTQEELDAAVDEAHRLGKKVACHTEHGAPSPEEIDLAVEKSITWTPTLNIGQEYLNWCDRRRKHSVPSISRQAEQEYVKSTEYLERKRTSMEYALKAGLKLAAGTDSYMGGVLVGGIRL